MVTSTLYPWPSGGVGGVTHVSTDWELASDISFSSVVDSTYIDSTNLIQWVSDAVVPIGETWYVRSRRHLSDANTTDWVVKEVTTSELSFLTNSGVGKIEIPRIKVVGGGFYDDGANFTITTSLFKATEDGHASTDWIIVNDANQYIYINTADDTNLTSITIAKDLIDYDALNGFIIKVAYRGVSGRKSAYGVLKVSLSDFYFTVTSELKSITPFLPYELTWVNEESTLGTRYVPGTIELVDKYGVAALSEDVYDAGALTGALTIDRAYLEENNTYKVNFYPYVLDGGVRKDTETIPKTVHLTTFADIIPFDVHSPHSINPAYTYGDDYVDTGITSTDAFGLFASTQNLDNTIGVQTENISAERIFALYGYDPVGSSFAESNRPNLFTDTALTINNYVPYRRHEVLMDISTIGVGATRKLIRWDAFAGIEISSIDVTSETLITATKPLDLAVDFANEKAYYLADDGSATLVLREWDILANTVSDVTVLPYVDNPNAAIVYSGDGNILIINGVVGGSNIYAHTLSSGVMRDIGEMAAGNISKRFISMMGMDGTIYLFNINDDDSDNNIVYIKTSDYSVGTIVSAIPATTNLTSVIRMRDGSFLRFDHGSATKTFYLFR